MTPHARLPRVLFRVAAGPRTGFGHLVRAASLADALGVPARTSIRGSWPYVAATARRLGARVVPPGSPADVLRAVDPDVLILDDREIGATAPWRRAARRLDLPVVSIHDLGLGVGDADLVVDGSVGAERQTVHAPALLGLRYAILNPRCVGTRDGRMRRGTQGVVIALGGGPRRAVAVRLARVLVGLRPGLRVGIAAGFVAGRQKIVEPGIEWVAPGELGGALEGAQLAVVGGGVTLYESLALGVPSIAVAVVTSQRPAIDAFAARAAVIDGGLLAPGPEVRRRTETLASQVVALLDDDIARQRLRRVGPRLVDGQGAGRVARAIEKMLASDRVWRADAR